MAGPRPRRCPLSLGLLLAVSVVAASCGSPGSAGPAPTSTKSPAKLTRISAPRTSPAQDGQYFTDLAKSDPGLATYVQTEGNVALRALLTDGSAFCAFLQTGGGIDNAMASVVIGARSVEPRTHLPSTVATFNAIDAVSLLTLCPSDQRFVPAADRTRIRALGQALAGGPSGT
ncbi:MAG: hypothetical protein ACLQVK_15360 [Acidimicrobiales bacterium]